MFWDGERWIREPDPNAKPVRPPHRRSIRDWLLTLPILLLVPALLVPIAVTSASTNHPRVTVSGTPYPGASVKLIGRGFRPGTYVQARWDNASTRLRVFVVGRSGAFAVYVKIPPSASIGLHKITIGKTNVTTARAASLSTTALVSTQSTISSLSVRVKRRSTPKAVAPAPTAVQTPSPAAAPVLTPNPAAAPAPIPTPAPNPGLKVVTLTPSVTATQFIAAVRDSAADVIELAGGTYHVGRITLSVVRTRPVIIRPAAGATVVFDGGGASAAFWIGYGGSANDITFDRLTFENYAIGTTGLFDLGDAHNITMNNIVVRNSTGQSSYSWALYLEGAGPTNVTAKNWTVDGNGKQYGAFTIEHPPGPAHVWLDGWHVTNVSYAIYAGGSANQAADINVSNWTIDSSGTNYSVVLVGTPGTIKNVHATNSSGPEILPPMVDAGGNTWK